MVKKYLFLILIVVVILVGLFKYQDLIKFSNEQNIQSQSTPKNAVKPGIQVIKTNPDPLEWAILLPDQEISITFNEPVENIGEFKYNLTPKFEYNIKLSNDKKTVLISPKSVYPLGEEITLFIRPETKFTEGKRLNSELIYHFKTIQHRGA